MTHYDHNNIFAKILRKELPCHLVYEDDKTLAFMDIMLQARGHVLLIPKTPAVELSNLPLEFAQPLFAAAQKIIAAQRQVLGKQGILQCQLNHSEAGQSVMHYHIHLIPTHIHQLGEHAQTTADHDELAQLAQQLREAIAAQNS